MHYNLLPIAIIDINHVIEDGIFIRVRQWWSVRSIGALVFVNHCSEHRFRLVSGMLPVIFFLSRHLL